MIRQRQGFVLTWFLKVILVVVIWFIPITVFAHSGGFPRLTGVEAGVYRLYAWTQPNPWLTNEDLHISVAVTNVDAATNPVTGPGIETLVRDANVTAFFTPPVSTGIFGSTEVSITRALTATESLGGIYYESDLRLPVTGDWQVKILATGALGESSADFVVTVLPSRQINWLLIGGGGAVFVLLLLVAAVIGRSRG